MMNEATHQKETVETITLFVKPCDVGMRLDVFLARSCAGSLSRERIKGLIRGGQVYRGVNREQVCLKAKEYVKEGDVFQILIPPLECPLPKPQNIPLEIVYEDAALIVINKPAGLVVHPAPGHSDGTLVNALLAHCGDTLSGIGGVRRPGIVHRLDKETSGLLVVAKNDQAHQYLSAQFADHGRSGFLMRRYDALVWGAPRHAAGTIDAPLARARAGERKVKVSSGGRFAITHWRREKIYGKIVGQAITHLSCHLETGRTHQIRAHMAHIGHPVLGDPEYSSHFQTKIAKLPPDIRPTVAAFTRQALHARMLAFIHPISEKPLVFSVSPPSDFRQLCAMLEGIR